MLLTLVIGSEVGFFVLLLAGLVVRYLVKMPRTGAVLLALSPLGYVAVLIAGAIDLARGGTSDIAHVFGAIVIGIVAVSGRHHLHAMDGWVRRKLAKEPKPRLYGAEFARKQRTDFYRRTGEWAVVVVLLAGGYALAGFDVLRGGALLAGIGFWTVVLVVDFIWSFSYTVFPRAVKTDSIRG
ncbi:hypothetical protein [Kutzneria sp. CA-103260]|uniref:hypothetical protein n=1 Tax=Kutzneria sp. CA-103260 TaxID=2802641 RepID=UPI001BACA41F|nr:hypothetical protein [Kutzneria sp. CA-103260]QUQ68002.1 hypothetical protein JJ691_57420 [Kutzneria sp. CA-103260]